MGQFLNIIFMAALPSETRVMKHFGYLSFVLSSTVQICISTGLYEKQAACGQQSSFVLLAQTISTEF